MIDKPRVVSHQDARLRRLARKSSAEPEHTKPTAHCRLGGDSRVGEDREKSLGGGSDSCVGQEDREKQQAARSSLCLIRRVPSLRTRRRLALHGSSVVLAPAVRVFRLVVVVSHLLPSLVELRLQLVLLPRNSSRQQQWRNAKQIVRGPSRGFVSLRSMSTQATTEHNRTGYFKHRKSSVRGTHTPRSPSLWPSSRGPCALDGGAGPPY